MIGKIHRVKAYQQYEKRLKCYIDECPAQKKSIWTVLVKPKEHII